jgi:hypothetical protein
MLVKLTVEQNKGRVNDIGSRLFSTDYIVDAKTVNTTKTSFEYITDKRSWRALPRSIKVTEGIATIKTAFGATWQTNYIDLPVFIDNDSTKSTETKTFAVLSVVYALPDASSPTTRSYVRIKDGSGKLNKYLVNYNLDQIVDVADTGATTTTTTTTTTTV